MKTKIDLTNKTVLVTGGIGFIGANLMMELLKRFLIKRIYRLQFLIIK